MEKRFGRKNLGDGPKQEFLNLLKTLVLHTNREKLKIDQKCFSWGSEE